MISSDNDYQEFLDGFEDVIDDMSDLDESKVASLFLKNLSKNWAYRTPFRAYPHGIYLNVKGVDIDEDEAMAFYETWKDTFHDIGLELLWVGRSGGWMGFDIRALNNFIQVDQKLIDTKAEFEYIAQNHDEADDYSTFWYDAGYDYGCEEVIDSNDYWRIDLDLLELLNQFETEQKEYPRF